jgi:nickel-dependent lactate racemase
MPPLNTRTILPFGAGTLSGNLPEWLDWSLLNKDDHLSAPDPTHLKTSLSKLITYLPKDIPHPPRVLLVVPDHTRRCRLETLLPPLLDTLEFEIQANIQILIANGSHVVQPESTLKDLVGKTVLNRVPVSQHDSKNSEQLVTLGKTSYGTPITLNRKVEDADIIITVGGILYHYFAGFGGGPKMLLPGIAGYETIRANHRRTIDPDTGLFHPECYEGNIDTNPVYQDLVQIVDRLPCLSFQVVLDPGGNIICSDAGPIIPVQRHLIPRVKELYTLTIPQKVPVVLASGGGHPTDSNLIQSHKAIHHAFQAVKPGGFLVIAAECGQGIGSSTFLPYAHAGSAKEIGQLLLEDYQINGHTALSLKQKAKAAHIYLLSALDANEVEKMGLIPIQNLKEAWIDIEKQIRGVVQGYVLPQANFFLPVLKS